MVSATYYVRIHNTLAVTEGLYYTGKKPTSKIQDAKLFKLQNAKNVRKFAHTGWCYDVVRVTNKMMFVMLLSGE